MNKLDKNLGIVVYSVSREHEAINTHLQSKNFKKLQNFEGHNIAEMRQALWDRTIRHATDLFSEIEMPEELGKMLLQNIPHLTVRLSHMYVVWKIKTGATRPIVPSFTAPTVLASKWIHEQLLPYVIKIPTICMDSLAYTRDLDKLALPQPWNGLVVCLDVVALYPSIPMKPSIEAVARFLQENTPLSEEAQNIILKVMEWVIFNNYVEHDNTIYHQVDGVVMGQALSVMVANIFMYKIVEEPVLSKWKKFILHYKRYVDDINTFMTITAKQAEEFKADLSSQSDFICFTMEYHQNRSDFWDLRIMISPEVFPFPRARIDYRIYRKPGNSLAYLCAESYHADHTAFGIVITELIRYLTKSSRREFYIEDAEMLYHAFRNRAYAHNMIKKGLTMIDWQKREYYRNKGLQNKIRSIPGGGAVLSTRIDPVMQTLYRAGFKIDLAAIRATSTVTADDDVRRALGHNLCSVFPKTGMIALKAAPKLKALFKSC